MTAMFFITVITHSIALILSLIRLERGPSTADRAVALDVTTAASMGILLTIIAMGNRIDLLPLVIVISAIGFITSTTIARFVTRDSDAESRILTWQEARVLDAQQALIKDSDLPAHMVDGEVEEG